MPSAPDVHDNEDDRRRVRSLLGVGEIDTRAGARDASFVMVPDDLERRVRRVALGAYARELATPRWLSPFVRAWEGSAVPVLLIVFSVGYVAWAASQTALFN